MAIDKSNGENLQDHSDAYYEELACQEEIYMEEVEERARAVLISCERHSITLTTRSPTSSKWRRQTPANSSPGARKHIADGRRTPVSSGEQLRFLEAFINAAQKGDMGGLEGLFAEGVVSCSNGRRLTSFKNYRARPIGS